MLKISLINTLASKTKEILFSLDALYLPYSINYDNNGNIRNSDNKKLEKIFNKIMNKNN